MNIPLISLPFHVFGYCFLTETASPYQTLLSHNLTKIKFSLFLSSLDII